MNSNAIITGILWVGYGAVHSIMAATSFKKRMQVIFGKAYKYYRIFYNLFAVATLAIILLYQFSFYSPAVFVPTFYSKIAGAIVVIIGTVIMSFCIVKYFRQESGFLWLNPAAADQKAELFISGIHKYVRHPLYLGTLIFIWGLFVIFPSVVNSVAAGTITIYTLIAIQFEEKKLIAEFGDAYREYKKKVPMIIPKLKSS